MLGGETCACTQLGSCFWLALFLMLHGSPAGRLPACARVVFLDAGGNLWYD